MENWLLMVRNKARLKQYKVCPILPPAEKSKLHLHKTDSLSSILFTSSHNKITHDYISSAVKKHTKPSLPFLQPHKAGSVQHVHISSHYSWDTKINSWPCCRICQVKSLSVVRVCTIKADELPQLAPPLCWWNDHMLVTAFYVEPVY